MNTGALVSPTLPITPAAPAGPRRAGALRAAGLSIGADAHTTDHRFGLSLEGPLRDPNTPEAARSAAEEFVAVALIEPILSSLRDNNHAAPPFAPTEAEKAFGPLLDAEIARRIVARERYGLVDAVARRLRKGPAPAPGAQPDAHVDAHA